MILLSKYILKVIKLYILFLFNILISILVLFIVVTTDSAALSIVSLIFNLVFMSILSAKSSKYIEDTLSKRFTLVQFSLSLYIASILFFISEYFSKKIEPLLTGTELSLVLSIIAFSSFVTFTFSNAMIYLESLSNSEKKDSNGKTKYYSSIVKHRRVKKEFKSIFGVTTEYEYVDDDEFYQEDIDK